MASVDPSKLEAEPFKSALVVVCGFFQVEDLHAEQINALNKEFFLGNNIFFSAGTGYGKSLVFQAVPLLADHELEISSPIFSQIIVCNTRVHAASAHDFNIYSLRLP